MAGWLAGLGVAIWLSRLANQVSPGIVKLEFARSTERTIDLVRAWGLSDQLHKLHSSVWPWDFPFIVAYVLLIVALCWWGRVRLASKFGRGLAVAVALAVVLAGILDVIEDVGLLEMIEHPAVRTWPAAVFGLATAKFALVGLGAVFGLAVALNRIAMAGEELLSRLAPGEGKPTTARRQVTAADQLAAPWTRFRRSVLRWLFGFRPDLPAPPPPSLGPSDEAPVGICCSGGGIRSAAFNLGVLQTFTCEDILGQADYLTAVSGGSYMAASYALVTARSDPAPPDPPAYSPGSPEEHFLRNHSAYLGPPGVAGKMWLGVRTLIGVAINVGVLVLLLFVIGRILGWWYRAHLYPELAQDPATLHVARTVWMVVISLAGAGVALTMGDLVTAPPDRVRRLLRAWSIRLLAAGLIALILLIGLPFLIKLFRHLPKAGKVNGQTLPNPLVLLNVAGIGTLLTGAIRTLVAKHRPWLGLLAGAIVGPLLLVGVFVYFARRGTLEGYNTGELWLVVSVASLFAFIYAFSDLTTWSPHPFYKRALWGSFGLRRVQPQGHEPFAEVMPFDEASTLSDVDPANWPELIVCAAANTSDEGATPPGRNATTFTFSSTEIGAPLTTFVATTAFEDVLGDRGRDISLIAAVAISGAAISPSMGKMTKGPLRFLMALLNIRLGVWVPNPLWFGHWMKLSTRSGVAKFVLGRPRPRYLLKELMGWNHLSSKFLYVTDGGHYENLGLVELLRRRCRLVYCIDASGGSEDTFYTLGEAVALARTELQVEIDIRPQTMAPKEAGGYAPTDFVVGAFSYPEDRKCPDGSPRPNPPAKGILIYIRAAVTEHAPDDVRSFRQKDPRFPHHGTQDQFFNESKFEAYRALGAHTASVAAKVFDPEYHRP